MRSSETSNPAVSGMSKGTFKILSRIRKTEVKRPRDEGATLNSCPPEISCSKPGRREQD
jgi:hypothetical protein